MAAISYTKIIPQDLAGKRLDVALSVLFPEYSRARLQQWIKQGYISVDGKVLDQSTKVNLAQTVDLQAEEERELEDQPQKIALEIVYEDDAIIIINKPVGLTVHPGAGQRDNTLLNALLYYDSSLANVPRAGIVHRLDKDTSGLLIVARDIKVQHKLAKAMRRREIKREYEAIVYGNIIAGSTINVPIARHSVKRTLMAVTENGRDAITHYRVLQRFHAHTHLRIMLETGRTHQIRVHLAHINHPIVGDASYGRLKIPSGASEELRKALQNFNHQALHAKYLALTHPRTGEFMEWESKLPLDMQRLLRILKKSS